MSLLSHFYVFRLYIAKDSSYTRHPLTTIAPLRKSMKKTASLLLGAALVMSLTGCETFLGGSSSSKTASGPVTTQYDCTDGTHFTITRNAKTPNQAILNRQGQTYEMTKVATRTGSDKLQHSSGLTYIGVSNMSSLVNFKQGKNISSECRSEEQVQIQKELDEKRKQEAAAKAEEAKKAAATKKTTTTKKTVRKTTKKVVRKTTRKKK